MSAYANISWAFKAQLENESKYVMVTAQLIPTTFLTYLYFTAAFGMFFSGFHSELCSSAAGRPGKCVRLNECSSATSVRKRQVYNLCKFDFYQSLVCCEFKNYSLPENAVYGRIAKQKCLEYSAKSQRRLNAFILNGIEASPKEFPHMVLLGFGSEDKINWRCGGSLISEKFILTAAHCLQYKRQTLAYAQLGTNYLYDKSRAAVQIKVRKTYAHPSRLSMRKYNDIGLVELVKKVDFDDMVKPACLHVEEKIVGLELIATGWGADHEGGALSPTLQKVNLNLVPFNICTKFYRPEFKLEQGIEDDQQFCASALNGGDTCQGDSGGPVQYRPEGSDLYVVAGITSFGIKCGMIPGVYTRVSHYIPWIESIVWPQ